MTWQYERWPSLIRYSPLSEPYQWLGDLNIYDTYPSQPKMPDTKVTINYEPPPPPPAKKIRSVTVEMTENQARLVRTLIAHVGGDYKCEVRKELTDLYEALGYSGICSCSTHPFIFKDQFDIKVRDGATVR